MPRRGDVWGGNKVRPWVEYNLDIFQPNMEDIFYTWDFGHFALTFFVRWCKTTPRCACMHMCTFYLLVQRKMNIKDDFCLQSDDLLSEKVWQHGTLSCAQLGCQSPGLFTVLAGCQWDSFLGSSAAKDVTAQRNRQRHKIITEYCVINYSNFNLWFF